MKKLNLTKRITLRLTTDQEQALDLVKQYYSIDNDTDAIRRLIYEKTIEIALDV
jgi:hypothetical protein